MHNSRRRERKGNVVTLFALLMPVLAGFGAFAIDAGYIAYLNSRLQAGADSAALATVQELPGDQATLDAMALQYVTLNIGSNSNLTVNVDAGQWNEDSQSFVSSSLADANAVRVTVQAHNNSLFFGRLLGDSFVDTAAAAIATKGAGTGFRFLIDDEMIDTDIPSIEDLANDLGRDVSELLTAAGFNNGKQYGDSDWTWEDNFLDLPPGETITLPTGQGTSYDNNDAGMFDIEHPEFPFTDEQSFIDFLMYSETGNDPSKWGTDVSVPQKRRERWEYGLPQSACRSRLQTTISGCG